ncbi:MAG: hypothetical protein ACLR8P_16045 [Clostridium fessum]
MSRPALSTIVRVFEGSPAEEAGILPGDALYKVRRHRGDAAWICRFWSIITSRARKAAS